VQRNTQLSVERVRVRPIRGGFGVGKCHRIASVGGRGWVRLGHQVRADRSPGRGEVVGSVVGWSVDRLLNSYRLDHYGGATSPEVEPTHGDLLTVRYGESRRHKRHRRCGCGEQTLRC
jgi:hypothetical protein